MQLILVMEACFYLFLLAIHLTISSRVGVFVLSQTLGRWSLLSRTERMLVCGLYVSLRLAYLEPQNCLSPFKCLCLSPYPTTHICPIDEDGTFNCSSLRLRSPYHNSVIHPTLFFYSLISLQCFKFVP